MGPSRRARRDGPAGAAHGLCRARRHPLRRHAVPQGHRLPGHRPQGLSAALSRRGPFARIRMIHAEQSLGPPMDIGSVKRYFTDLQSRIVARLEAIDGGSFRRDAWDRPEGGGGVSRIIEQGKVLERGGVNFSHVKGDRLPPSATATRPQLAGRAFEVLGVSLVLHPLNPYAPTVHMNVRLFAARREGVEDLWWFGGGMDLTPYYGFEEDAIHFHRTCRDALAPFGPDVHARYKRWCDEYFFLRHRS